MLVPTTKPSEGLGSEGGANPSTRLQKTTLDRSNNCKLNFSLRQTALKSAQYGNMISTLGPVPVF